MVAEPVVNLLAAIASRTTRSYVESVSEIGPAIGHKLRQDAELALLISALAIIIYLAWRFEFKFGVRRRSPPSTTSSRMVGIFWALGIEMDLLFITALLTIGGYSLTDTVVVFDRIRENIRLRKKKTFSETINLSVNEVLSRTIVTSLTVFIAVVDAAGLRGDRPAQLRAGPRDRDRDRDATPRSSSPARSSPSGAARR